MPMCSWINDLISVCPSRKCLAFFGPNAGLSILAGNRDHLFLPVFQRVRRSCTACVSRVMPPHCVAVKVKKLAARLAMKTAAATACFDHRRFTCTPPSCIGPFATCSVVV